ncbi:MAG TPA: hypothetical protein VK645_18080, partial [Chitinophagaceae bacterium]|nr:hypothetical protein [Chitinophagaceae bacterium]
MDGKRNGVKVDYWTPTNASNWFPEPQATVSPVSTAWTTLGYYDASFIKIRSVNFGYTFSGASLKRLRAQSVRLYFTVDNIGYLYSPYKKQTGIAPEGTNIGNSGVSDPGNIRAGTNGVITISASTPPTRNFIVGANITL